MPEVPLLLHTALHEGHDGLLVGADIRAARRCVAGSTGDVIGRIDGLAFGAGILVTYTLPLRQLSD